VKITSNINAEAKELVLNLEQTQKDEKQDIRLFDFEVEVEVIEVIEDKLLPYLVILIFPF